jgi:hypothetical protein
LPLTDDRQRSKTTKIFKKGVDMKNRFLIELVTFSFLCVAFAFGGSASIFYVNTGFAKAVAPQFMKDVYIQGFHVGVMYGLRLTPRFEIQGAVSLNNFGFDNEGFRSTLNPDIEAYTETHHPVNTPDVNISGDAAYAWNLYANIKWIIPPEKEGGKVDAYVFLGGGLFGLKKGQISAEDAYLESGGILLQPNGKRMIPAKTETVFGTGFGFGLEFLLEEHTNFFVELGASIGFTKSDPTVFIPSKPTVFIPLKFGISIRP